ncbi:hypothetical protein L6452_15362 [Arctium lappa]|uniref:Uncharacterized protein n=1 Tax=Arctium lappa TaxID=4217 RepID=A0ACB9CNI6_ARCLA|nr:hypothetical protein L6452_15362 [Arctium lappa]
MPNGSLEKFIYRHVPLKTCEHLGVEKLYEVALGIARGLDYLHRGCNTRILHLDIKPHNILLDEDFCPKITDFGLAKLYSRKESIVSMLEARGTIGAYIESETRSSSSNCVAIFEHKTEDEKSVETFVVQYGSLSTKRTSHVNIVTLLGFCFEHKKRALVYEFMPNGSLDKFIYRTSPIQTSENIRVGKLYEIALGIARGLDYLHRGCNTRILHLDIKPHNILLDEDFCPKIADFGLAKLYSRKESIVYMFEARGMITLKY